MKFNGNFDIKINSIEGIERLMIATIKSALHDLYFGKPKDHDSALLFFTKSNLFKMTGLNFEYLKSQYEKYIASNKILARKLKRINKKKQQPAH